MPRRFAVTAVAALGGAVALALQSGVEERHRVAGAESRRPRPGRRPAVGRGRALRRQGPVEVGRRRRLGGQGRLRRAPRTGITTKDTFGDCQLHVEFATPAEVKGNGQGRGNSGVFLMDRYEVQVLDSYDNKTYFDGQCGAIYKQTPPMVNACRKPGEWQTYDILFERAAVRRRRQGRSSPAT